MECAKLNCDQLVQQQTTSNNGGLINLEDLPVEELKTFLGSFDNILSDCDGVLWHNDDPIEGVDETMSTLRGHGKHIRFISNNGTMGIKGIFKKLINAKVGAKLDDLIVPTIAVINHLKKINFNKKIFFFGTDDMRKDLTDAGYGVVSIEEGYPVKDFNKLFDMMGEDESVGAIVFDVDFNINFVNFQQALFLLRRPDVHYIVGSADHYIPFKPNMNMIGPARFQNLLADMSGKKPVVFGKPSLDLNKYIVERYNLNDPSRTLFVGDSLQTDMPFASACGYQKLLVLSGISTLEEAKRNAGGESYPDYYVRNLGVFGKLIKKLQTQGVKHGVKAGINKSVTNGVIKVS